MFDSKWLVGGEVTAQVVLNNYVGWQVAGYVAMQLWSQRIREGDRRRGGNSEKTNLTKNQLVDNDDRVDDDKGYCIVACVSYSVGPWLVYLVLSKQSRVRLVPG